MTWQEDRQVTAFLERAHALNLHNAIEVGQKTKPLLHPFWEMSEIADASGSLAEWDVQPSLVPFYGDWHDLLCVDMASSSPSVVHLNDERTVLHRWESLATFEASLKTVEEESSTELGVVEEDSWLDF